MKGFIEVTTSEKICLNVSQIVWFDSIPGGTRIFLRPAAQNTNTAFTASETYEEVKALIEDARK